MSASWSHPHDEALPAVRPVGQDHTGSSTTLGTTTGQATHDHAKSVLTPQVVNQTTNEVAQVPPQAQPSGRVPAGSAGQDTITVSGRSMMVARLFGDTPQLALTPDTVSVDDMRLAQGKTLTGPGSLAAPPVAGMDVAGKYGATQASHPALQAVVALGVLNKLTTVDLAAMSPKSLAAGLVYQFLTAADRQVISQIYDYVQAQRLNPALVDALAYDLGVYRSAAAGASIITDHVGRFAAADGRVVMFGFSPGDEAIAVRILTSGALRSTALPQDWLRYQLDPGLAVGIPRTPLAFLEQVVNAFLPESPAGGAPDELAPRPLQRWQMMRQAALLNSPPVAASDEEQQQHTQQQTVSALVTSQRYLARVDRLVGGLPLEAVASVASAASLQEVDSSTRLVAGLLQVFTQHDKQLFAALYAGAEAAHGPASPEINKLDLMVRQMALAAALGAVPGAEVFTQAGKKRRRLPQDSEGKHTNKQPRGGDYQQFNAWLEDQDEQEAQGEAPSETHAEAQDETPPEDNFGQPLARNDENTTGIGPRFAEELGPLIEHRKLYG